jgi:hypothetical protein
MHFVADLGIFCMAYRGRRMRTNFKLTLMDFFDSPKGREYLAQICTEVIDNYQKEHPEVTREEIVSRFKALV